MLDPSHRAEEDIGRIFSNIDLSARDSSQGSNTIVLGNMDKHTGARITDSTILVQHVYPAQKDPEEPLSYAIDVSHDATHDQVAYKDKNIGCSDNTRKAILEKLLKWCEESNEPLCWVQAQAGMGKTTLLLTLCKELKARKLLGASFFCSGTEPTRRELRSLIPTICYQFAELFDNPDNPLFMNALKKPILPKISKSFQSEPCPEYQLDELIIKPLEATDQQTSEGGRKYIVVLDALDECEEDPLFLLESLRNLGQLESNPSFKIVIASRPDQRIQKAFDRRNFKPTTFGFGDDKDAKDVETYFTGCFPDFNSSDIDFLVEWAGSVFVFAAALVRYLDPFPADRLSSLRTSRNSRALSNVWDKLTIYDHILSTAFNDKDLEERDKERLSRILFTVICAREPVAAVTIAGLWPGDIKDPKIVKETLSPLQSILTIPEDGNQPITALHSTVYEYIKNPPSLSEDIQAEQSQSKYFRCQPEKFNAELAYRCLKVMNGTLEQSIPDLPLRPGDHSISPSLHYSCEFWAEHWELSEYSQILHLRLELNEFFRTHVFHWFQTLSLINKLGVATRTLDTLLRMLKNNSDTDKELFDLVYHSFRFIDMAFATIYMIRDHGLKAYNSALEFVPNPSPLRKHYAHLWDQPRRLRAICGVYTSWLQWGPNVILTNHANKVTSIAISPGADRLFSKMENQHICAWNLQTRERDYTLNKTIHIISDASEQKYPAPIAISSDGQFIISRCSIDSTKIWEINNHKQFYDLKSDRVTTINAVAVSPEGDLVCSGGDDGAVHIWEISSRQLLSSLDPSDRKAPVSSISFGPNENQIVSGSLSGSAFIWNSRSRRIEYVLNKHSKAISSVATSAKSKKVVIGSDDHTISLWDDRGGEIYILKGHGDRPVKCVTFFPDGTKFASGGADGSLVVWNVENGDRLFHFERSNPITSIAVFPDGVRIASSAGTEIAIWNLRGRQTIGSPPGQRSLVGPAQTPRAMTWKDTESMVFSPDGGVVLLLPSLRLLDTRTLEEKVAFPDLPETKKFVVGAMRANLLVAATKRTIYVWRLPEVGASSLSSHMTIDIPGPSVQTNLTQPESRKKVQIIVTYEHACTAIDISSDGKKIVSASNDFMVWVWSAETGEKLLGLEHTKPNNRVARAAFSTDGSRIAAAANNSAFHIWDANNGNLLFHFPLRTDLGAINFSPDNHHIIGLRFRSVKQVLVWEVNNASTEPVRKHDGFMHWTMLSSGVSYTYKDGWIWQADKLDSAPQQRYWIPLHYRPNVKVFGPTFTSCEEGVQVCLGREDGMVTLTFPTSS